MTPVAARALDSTDQAIKLEAEFAFADLGRYMEGDCERTQYPGWEGFPTIECTYTGPGQTKLIVVMLNPDREKLARWIVSACKAAKLDGSERCFRKLWAKIKAQSGSQFPIAGLVDESYEPCDSVCFITFRNGIAVHLKALDAFPEADRAGRRSLKAFDLHNTEHVARVLSEPFDLPGDMARIASTTLDELNNWLRAHPADAPPAGIKTDFPDLISHYYKLAWTSDRNVLIDAWAVAHKAELK